MGSEVEKMYENAELLYCKKCRHYSEIDCIYICENKNPAFIAEKQLELIRFLMEQEDFSWTITQQGKVTEYAFYVGYEHSSGDFKEFTEALAGIINNLWQDLTKADKAQIKEILE